MKYCKEVALQMLCSKRASSQVPMAMLTQVPSQCLVTKFGSTTSTQLVTSSQLVCAPEELSAIPVHNGRPFFIATVA